MIGSHAARTGFPAILALALAGCGDANDSNTAAPQTSLAAYPALATAFAFEQDDVDRMLLSGAGRAITSESVKTFVIGTGIRRDTSEYLNRPILDIAALANANFLDRNLQSASVEVSSIKLETNKKATDDSWQFKQSFGESASLFGFGGQAAHDSDEKDQKLKSSGDSTVRFSRVNSGGYVRILEGGFSGPADLSRYLAGEPLSPAQLRRHVSYDECAVSLLSLQRYVCKLTIPNGGKITEAGENVYGSIQVIGELQSILARARDQYAQYGDAAVRATLVEVMRTLRTTIRERISDFYANNGQAFVSEIALMNEAKGIGTLSFSQNSGRNEHRTGVAVSVGYQGSVGGASFSTDIQQLKVKGWANSFKNVTIEATASPASDSVNTLEWAEKIMALLNNESQPISVPQISGLPGLADLKLPPLATAKPLLEAPAGTFTSYEEWQRYKNDLAAPQAAVDASIAKAARGVKDWSVNLFRRAPAALASAAPPPVDHRALTEELERIETIRDSAPAAAPRGGLREANEPQSNIMRVDRQFVSGFRTIDYERVIPQLRPNLEIPGEPLPTPSLFENITALRMLVDRVDDATAYLRFLGNVPASRVNPDMAVKFAAFGRQFRQRAFALISAASVNGTDLNPSTAQAVIDDLFGLDDGSNRAESVLYRQFNDVDQYNYVRFTLLDPKNMALWADAPGGFIPYHFRKTGDENVVAHHSVSGVGYEGGRPYIRWDDAFPYGDPSVNPIDFYGAKTATGAPAIAMQTPWFPIFQFNRARPGSLVFLQMAGPNHIIYGRRYVIMPVAATRTNSLTSPNFNDPNPVNPNAQLSEAMLQRIADPANSFETACTGSGAGYDSRFSLYFPGSTPDPARTARFRVLVLPVGPECNPGFVNPAVDNGYEAVNWIDGYRGFNVEWMSGSSRIPYLLGSDGAPTTLFRFWGNQAGRAFVVLLPINATSVESRFDATYRWGAPRTLESLVISSDYKDFITARLMH